MLLVLQLPGHGHVHDHRRALVPRRRWLSRCERMHLGRFVSPGQLPFSGFLGLVVMSRVVDLLIVYVGRGGYGRVLEVLVPRRIQTFAMV